MSQFNDAEPTLSLCIRVVGIMGVVFKKSKKFTDYDILAYLLIKLSGKVYLFFKVSFNSAMRSSSLFISRLMLCLLTITHARTFKKPMHKLQNKKMVAYII